MVGFRTAAASVAAAGFVWAIGPGCSTAPRNEEARQKLSTKSSDALNNFRHADPAVQSRIDTAYGYAVFPTVGKGAVGVGGAYGKGEVYEQGRMVGYCDLTQASIGLALGGQAYSELILFENQAALDQFKSGNFAFDAQVSAVALRTGASQNAPYRHGVAVFTVGERGLMYEASVGGQKFGYRPM